MTDYEKYLTLLVERYPNIRSVTSEIINLSAILNLPKGTEHFMSDIHGEYEAFCHILNNCSGVIREKTERIFRDRLTAEEQDEICTLIYYPKEKLRLLKKERDVNRLYADTLTHDEIKEICTLIYYPREKLELLKSAGTLNAAWYGTTIGYLIEITRLLSSMYTRSKVR